MEKKFWKDALQRIEAILLDAKDTKAKSSQDIEELEYMVKQYKIKISSLPDVVAKKQKT
jgi:hypothetical protein